MSNKVALCFWGLCRSTSYTIESIKKNILKKLKEFNIDYDIYIHTYQIFHIYNNQRSNEININLDNDLYKLLNPNYYAIDNQDEIDKILNFEKYRKYGCPWNSNNYETLNNHIRSLYSLKKITELLIGNNINYKYVIFLRPDVFFENELLIDFFNILPNEIILPNFAKFPVNDRFAICNIENAKIYGLRYDLAYKYSLEYPLHSETFLKYILNINNIKIKYIEFYFYRIRSNGIIVKEKYKN